MKDKNWKPCMSYCSHGGVCILDGGHKGKHDSKYCTWTDEEGLTKEQGNKILIEKTGDIGKLICSTESSLLKSMGIKT